MNRIVVLGTSGSGKSTFAERLCARLNIPCYDIDVLAWMPGWQQRPREALRARIAEVAAGDRWAVSGNYSTVRDVLWPRADTVIWLDYPLRIVLWRLFRRTLKRVITKENLWGTGNVEQWSNFFSRDKDTNIFRWALYSHPKHRAEYPIAFQQPEYAHLNVIRLTTPRAADEWLKQFPELK
ncbi:MAG: adenylate kinase [Anaerolineae bacterium]